MNFGFRTFWRKFVGYFKIRFRDHRKIRIEEEYSEWVKQTSLNSEDLLKKKENINNLSYQPKISFVGSINDSIKKQIYSNWEVVDSLEKSEGEFVFFSDENIIFEPNFLYENIKRLNSDQNIDLLYCDEDELDSNSLRKNPKFKPNWSPETLLSTNYINHGFYRLDLIKNIGEFKSEYDLLLKISDSINLAKVSHIEQILYHVNNLNDKNSCEINLEVLRERMQRINILATVEDGLVENTYRIKRKIRNNPKVTIIIPTKDKADYVKRCVSSIESKTKTEGFSYEIVIVNHESKDQETLNYFDSIRNAYTILDYSGDFNYSKINNFAVQNTQSDYLLFLNNDTEVINEEWLYEMLQIFEEKNIGAVGAKLLFENNTIQHAGVYIHEHATGGHIYRGLREDTPGYMNRIKIVNNVSGVTAACLLIKREVFEMVGGFDENLVVAFNDVDLCLKLLDRGYRNVYTPYSQLYHYESMSRGGEDSWTKIQRFNKEWSLMIERWKNSKFVKHDQYYNQNLSFSNSDSDLELNFDIEKEI